MEVEKVSFAFMSVPMSIKVPFFQRSYVWREENWEELLENITSTQSNHFLGSIIFKQLPTKAGEVACHSVIDGQQRLTTLSILLKACYDTLPFEKYGEEIRAKNKGTMEDILFYKEDSFSTKRSVKISHSHVDSKEYETIVLGDNISLDNIVLDSEVKTRAKIKKISSGLISQCYKYFVLKLNEDGEDAKKKIWENLTSHNNSMLVKIDLGQDENEQAIFDAINSAGLRLSCSDTIKNAIFQVVMDKKVDGKDVIDLYKKHWGDIFSDNADTVKYWETPRRIGRLSRDNIEILLHGVAVIKGFFDPDGDRLPDIADLYKKYIKEFDYSQICDLIEEIGEYAKVYRNYFINFESSALFSFKDALKRLLHILNICEISTFNPYILKILKEEITNNNGEISDESKIIFKKLEKYILRHTLCGVTTKSFNKECAYLLKGNKTIDDLISEKPLINDDKIKISLSSIPDNKNKLAALILFWIELSRRAKEAKYDTNELGYNYTLEHIMPQSWKNYWGIDVVPVFDKNGKKIENKLQAEEERESYVCSVGNMTLLTFRLNASLQNFDFKRKLEGEGKNSGIKKYADLSITKEIIEKQKWDERDIQNRFDSICREFLSLW